MARGVVALGLGAGAAFAPLPLGARVGGMGLMAAYLLWTALGGRCLGYSMMGRSTCSTERGS
jgi:hypothetical protein